MFCVFLRNASFHEENGFMCIVRKSGQSHFRNAVFFNHCWHLFLLSMRLGSLLGCRDLLGLLKHKLFVTGSQVDARPFVQVWACLPGCAIPECCTPVSFPPKKSLVLGLRELSVFWQIFCADLHLARFQQHNTVQSKLYCIILFVLKNSPLVHSS